MSKDKADLAALLHRERERFSADATLAFPGEGGFASATGRWNLHAAPNFSASISAATEADVAEAVRIARSTNIPFLATSSRHGYLGTLARLKDGLAIDLSRLNTLSVDKSAATVTIGPGVTNLAISQAAYDAGLEAPLGICSTVSYIGSTVGGGIGRWAGTHGLLLDNILSARVVTANGDVVEASEAKNADLFWGLRGAGANFGIVVSATYKLHKPLNGGKVLNLDVAFTIDKKTDYFTVLKSFADNGELPSKLAALTAVICDPNSGMTLITANWVWLGPEEEGRKIMAKVQDLGPVVSNLSVVPYTELITTASSGADAILCQYGQRKTMFGAALRKLSLPTLEQTVEKMHKYYMYYPEGRASMAIIEAWPNQAVAAVPSDTTAFPWRDAMGYVMLHFDLANETRATEEVAHKLARELRSDFVTTSGYDDLAIYVNYAHGDETPEQVYGKAKLHRLAALKKQFDPDNVFSYYHALPTEYRAV